MKRALLLIIIFNCIVAKAQVPGYQGLRFSAQYDCGIMHPALVGRRGTGPYIYNNFSADYVLSRGLSLGVKYTYMHYNNPPNRGAIPGEFGYDSEGSFNPNDYKRPYDQHCIAVIGKAFLRRAGYIAPVGRYIAFGLYYQYAIDNFIEPVSNSGSSQYAAKGYKGKANIAGLVFGVGRNFIVADRIIIDFGATFNIPFFVPSDTKETDIVARDVFYTNLFQLHLGIGALAF